MEVSWPGRLDRWTLLALFRVFLLPPLPQELTETERSLEVALLAWEFGAWGLSQEEQAQAQEQGQPRVGMVRHRCLSTAFAIFASAFVGQRSPSTAWLPGPDLLVERRRYDPALPARKLRTCTC